MTDVELTKLKSIELDLLDYFIKICNDNNLKYYLVGGTLLGSIRHRGFIPWDDDIDVSMPRRDYEKFIKIAQNLLPTNIFLQNEFTDNEFPMNFSKLRNTNTTFVEKSVRNINMNHGVYIDIFPLDGYPTRKMSKKILKYKLKIYKRAQYKGLSFDDDNLSFKDKVLNFVVKIFCKDYRDARSKLDDIYKKYDYDKSSLISNYCGAWGDKEIVPKEYFGQGIEGSFEGRKIKIPLKYHEYLTNIYGDYLTLPPEEKRIAHHDYSILDLDKSYTNYLKL